ncbi:hypothetical protein D6T64_18560 [Cryobacterium melibiosiphilum]|uniref:Uncharacterized protein n=1 Tax=Cryobacterium melibiosiphilum TaxID=995039 RepID=A0A3A5MCP8_9MICO|nr:hypothetical protein [Cryobacterium melibiosiphilum]RJT85625.1 hypothetical protein D6T64_18560 [Cryobacterium melibiosiphilum]
MSLEEVDVSVLAEILIALAVTGLVSTVTVVLITRMLYRRIRRNSALSSAALRTRARVSTGPRRKVLKLRVRLRETLDSAQAAYTLAARSDGPKGELPQLFRRIHRQGLVLESQLKLMESEHDARALANSIADATRQVDQVAGMVGRLRSSVTAGLNDLGGDTLDSLHAEVDREVAALDAGVQELRLLNGADDLYPPHPLGSRPTSLDHQNRGNKL